MMAGLFGMNLTSGIEETPYAFLAVTGSTAVVAFLVYLYSSRILKKVRHVALVGRPTSLPESVRDAKQRFVRERAERERALEAAACAAEAAAASGEPAAGTNPIPDYETRWGEVRSRFKSRQSLWDRMFRPHSIRRALLGMRAQQPAGNAQARATEPRRSPIPPSSHAVPPSPTRSPNRPTAPRSETPSLGRSHSIKRDTGKI